MSNLSNNALSVLKARYLLRDETGTLVETPEAMFSRVASCISNIDNGLNHNNYLDILQNLEFLPNSPTLSNAGCRTGQLSACYVLGIEDNIDSIFDTMKLAAKVHKSGGGTGFSFSNLRPRNDMVKSTRGVSSGPIGFMDMYNSATEVIKQGSQRRGANMAILRVDHPNILEFINHKNKLDRLNNFNISVALTDDFMRALAENGSYDLINPRDKQKTGSLDARMVIDTIIVNAHSTGEPGVIFLDRMNEYCPVPWLGQYEATNPCFAPGTMIMTSEGHFPIETLVGKTVTVWDGESWVTTDSFRVTGENIDLYEVELENGQTIQATPYHKFVLESGETKILLELKTGDTLETHSQIVEGSTKLDGAYFLGFMRGDGSCEKNATLYLYPSKFVCIDRLVASASELETVEKSRSDIFKELDFVDCGKNRLVMRGTAFRRDAIAPFVAVSGLPEGFLNWDNESKYNFIAGYLDADGTTIDTKNGFGYQISGINKKLLLDVQIMLKTIGISSKLSLNKKEEFKDFGNRGGVLFCKELWRLIISQVGSVLLSHKINTTRLKSFKDRETKYGIKLKHFKVRAVTYIGVEPLVYCCTIPITHKISLSNSVCTSQCGEKPLLPYESCNLGSINLEKFVQGDRIDWARLEEVVKLSIRFLDNVIDANVFPHPELERMAKYTRNLGLGVMGFAGLLYRLGIQYGSETSLKIAGKVMSFVDYHSKKESIQLAKEKGRFPASIGHEEESYALFEKWFKERDKNKYLSPIVRYADLLPDLLKYGIRNSTTTTIAPTGTISIIANCSSGCEPVYALAFERNQAGMKMLEVDSYFEGRVKERFDPFTDYLILDDVSNSGGSLVSALKKSGDDDEYLTRLAEVFVTAHDITPTAHIEVQSVFQQFNDSATSKTINFPESATISDVEDAYMLAWKLGCKGVTVYRDKSREFQPLSTPQAPPIEITNNDACLVCGNCVPCGETCSCDKEDS